MGTPIIMFIKGNNICQLSGEIVFMCLFYQMAHWVSVYPQCSWSPIEGAEKENYCYLNGKGSARQSHQMVCFKHFE